jgi:hypothetical protein
LLTFWNDIFQDPISPLIYFNNDPYLIDFINDFLERKSKKYDVQLVILWLFTPKEKTFPRLKYYLTAKEFDFTTHLKMLFDNAPDNLPNETELAQFAMIHAILRVFPILQENLLTREQTLATLSFVHTSLKYLTKSLLSNSNQSKSGFSLKQLFHY